MTDHTEAEQAELFPDLPPPPRIPLHELPDAWDSPESEAQLLAGVIRECQQLSLFWHHDYGGNFALIGYPDLTIAGDGGVMWRELKTWSGLLSTSQQAWAQMLLTAGLDYAVWTPADRASGRISRELAQAAGLLLDDT